MVPIIIISENSSHRAGEIDKILVGFEIKKNGPDILYFDSSSKMGIDSIREIKKFLSTKPYLAGKPNQVKKVVVIEEADNLTTEAQNSLLKTLEEPPPETVIILAASSENSLLSTVLSRCRLVRTKSEDLLTPVGILDDISRLLTLSDKERFEYVEKIKNRGEFLNAMAVFFKNQLPDHPEFGPYLDDLLLAQKWAKANVNIRAILEYLMLKMPH